MSVRLPFHDLFGVELRALALRGHRQHIELASGSRVIANFFCAVPTRQPPPVPAGSVRDVPVQFPRYAPCTITFPVLHTIHHFQNT